MIRFVASTLLSLAALTVLGGCPGSLEDPGRFDGSAPPPGCDAEEVLVVSCGTDTACHDADAPQAGLDLVSPGVASRLVDVPAAFCIGSGNIVDSADPQGASFLLEKLDAMPSCGLQMPPGAPLSAQDRACLGAWVDEITAGGGSDSGAMDAATDAPTADASADAAEGGS